MKVEVRNGNVNKAMQVLKKKMAQQGIFNDLRKKRHYIKPSQKRRQQRKNAIQRQKKEQEAPQ